MSRIAILLDSKTCGMPVFNKAWIRLIIIFSFMIMLFNFASSSGYDLGSIDAKISRSVKNSSFSPPNKLSPGAMFDSGSGLSKTFF